MESVALRAALVWLFLAVAAVLNGVFREAVLKSVFGERIAHAVSTLLLGGIILSAAFAARGWIGISSIGSAWLVGFFWLMATLAFEFLAGHYLFGNSWNKIFVEYNAANGRVWIMIPIHQ